MKWIVAALSSVLFLFAALVLLAFAGSWSEAILVAAGTLVSGWTSFLHRSWQQMTWNLDAIATGLVLSVAILLITQFVGRAFSPRWSWRWTSVLFGALCWVFAVTIGSSGLVISSRELATTPKLVVDSSRSANIKMLAEAKSFSSVLLMADWDSSKVWHSPDEFLAGGVLASLLERYEIVLIPGPENRVNSVVFMHRGKLPRSERQKLALVDHSGSAVLRPMEELSSILATPAHPTPEEQ
jgi:MFS family permease